MPPIVPSLASILHRPQALGGKSLEGMKMEFSSSLLFLKGAYSTMKTFIWLIGGFACFAGAGVVADAGTMKVVESRMIWSEAPHSAFTDLHRAGDNWYCTFREGAAHVSPDGAVRILASDDGREWRSIARLEVPWADLRDPKLTETPNGKMLLTAGALLHEAKDGCTNRSLAWLSEDGTEWDGPHEIGEPNIWMWSCERHKDALYSFGYFKTWPALNKGGFTKETSPQARGANLIRLYRSEDGLKWTPIVSQSYEGRYINETAITFQPDGRMIAITRRDNGPEPRVARIGVSAPPYTEWKWREANHRLNGPAICALPDGRIVAGGRWKVGPEHTRLGWVDAETGMVTPALILPSKPETGYPSIVHHEGQLHISYYGSQEGKPAIYFAVVSLSSATEAD